MLTVPLKEGAIIIPPLAFTTNLDSTIRGKIKGKEEATMRQSTDVRDPLNGHARGVTEKPLHPGGVVKGKKRAVQKNLGFVIANNGGRIQEIPEIGVIIG